MLQLVPQIVHPTATVELPRPILVLRLQDSWDYMKLKVPLKDGDAVVGHSRTGVDIAIEGQIGSQSGNLKINEADMFATLQSLRSVLHVSSEQTRYEFTLYQDAQTGFKRYFRDCTTVRFDYDLSTPHLYSYAITIHASDPTIYDGP